MNYLLLLVFALSNILWWNKCREWRKTYNLVTNKLLDLLESTKTDLEKCDKLLADFQKSVNEK